MVDEKIQVLYVDDEVNNLHSFKAAFRRDFMVFTAESAKDGLKILEQEKIEIIITDQRMPEMTGVEFLESVIPHYPEPIRILLTGYTDIQAVIDALTKAKYIITLQSPGTKTSCETSSIRPMKFMRFVPKTRS